MVPWEFVKTLIKNPMLRTVYNFPTNSRHPLSMAWENNPFSL
jgi:hypothetical protein